MSAITHNGNSLAAKLNPAIGTTRQIREICSLICRHAATHHRLCEDDCNIGLDAYGRRRMTEIEERIEYLIARLPETDDGPFGSYFQHDPRGATVGLIAPDAWFRLYDGFGQDRINVPHGKEVPA